MHGSAKNNLLYFDPMSNERFAFQPAHVSERNARRVRARVRAKGRLLHFDPIIVVMRVSPPDQQRLLLVIVCGDS